jgi:ribonuclease E
MNLNSKHIIISEKNKLAAVYNIKKLKELHIFHRSYQIGNIYIGTIDTILNNIEAAFIKLSYYDKNGFLHVASISNFKEKIPEKTHVKKKILVQIIKEPTSSKGPTLSTNIGIIGTYIILLPFESSIKVSKNIIDIKERIYLKGLLHLLKPIKMGLLIKKEAVNVNSKILEGDFYRLQKKWRRIKTFVKEKKLSAPCLIDNNASFIQKIIKKLYDVHVTKISTESLTNTWEVYYNLMYLGHKGKWNPIVIEYLPFHKSLIKNFYLDFSLYYILQPKIELVTGGSIFIEKTEALTAIDINSGSFNQKNGSRATILWINCEAASEIVKQIILRNLGGIIVIDFIDMAFQKDQLILLHHLNNILKKQKSQVKIIQLSEIGLVELTRKRQGQNIYDAFGYKCHNCEGLGYYLLFSKSKSKCKSLFSFDSFLFYSK